MLRKSRFANSAPGLVLGGAQHWTPVKSPATYRSSASADSCQAPVRMNSREPNQDQKTIEKVKIAV